MIYGINPGDRLSLSYPLHTDIRHIEASGFRRRHIEVRRIRDLVQQPLLPMEFLRRPLVARSRWLISGIDCETSHWRNFYLGSSEEFAAPRALRIAIVCPYTERIEHFVSDQYDQTGADYRELARQLGRMADEEIAPQLRIVPADMRRLA
ncbi:hypothetical protein [Crateriforma conspicua]|uniref:Uncharacterized protein n=1 Tax=Crateriforma conspicua TaxID=2527996 RepID=A0A5C5XS28_9PLAN|nr:hypothetical protein [Crateriforma conspicua]TWT65660.1 hypothetical protein Pan14r_52080 [Crateriforma conspicua]